MAVVFPAVLLLLQAAVGQTLTPAPRGPFRIEDNRILATDGSEFLVRGTRLGTVPFEDPPNDGYGRFSRTTMSTLRQRVNLNAVRLGVLDHACESEGYRQRVLDAVAKANQFELLAIVEADAPNACTAALASHPIVFFAVTDASMDEIRILSASHPVIVRDARLMTSNTILEIRPSYASMDSAFRAPSRQTAVLVDGLDPHFESAYGECAAFPSDPAEAAALLQRLLRSFDEQHVSWTISTAESGKLVDNYLGYNWSKLDDGWTCGETPVRAGIGMTVLAHLWNADPHGLITVNQTAGGFTIARGANATAYGRTLGAFEEGVTSGRRRTSLGGISMRVTDAKGVARLAPLTWSGGGWSNINLAIPAESALGPAEVTVLRPDGSRTSSRIIIAEVAPALWTHAPGGRGPVVSECPHAKGAATTLRMEGTGFRFASSKAGIRVLIDGVGVPVLRYGPIDESRDEIVVTLPDALIGRGEVDVFLIVDGVLSNVARLHCGAR